MEKENKYPIKYAVLELKEKGGYLVGYKDIARGNIVSKCYVLESTIRYTSDGGSNLFHIVVFPFSNLETFKRSLRNQSQYIGEKTIPRYDFDNDPYKATVVSELFDTYEEAKEKAQAQNEKMKSQTILEISYHTSGPNLTQAIADYEQEFTKHLAICQSFEELALLKTEDMNITPSMSKIKKMEVPK